MILQCWCLNMLEFRRATKYDIPELIGMWTACFGSEELPYADLFFRSAFVPERSLLACVSGTVTSMTHWLPCDLLLHGQRHCAAYFYAGATFPHAAKHGYASAMLHASIEDVKQQGISAGIVYCLPSSKCIFDRNDFSRLQGVLKSRFLVQNGSPFNLQPCRFDDFIQLRAAFEQQQDPCLAWSAESLHYLYHDALASGHILWDAQSGVYALSNTVTYDTLRVNETNCPAHRLQELCNAIGTRSCCSQIDVLTPLHNGASPDAVHTETIYRGHARSFSPTLTLPDDLYLGIVAD